LQEEIAIRNTLRKRWLLIIIWVFLILPKELLTRKETRKPQYTCPCKSSTNIHCKYDESPAASAKETFNRDDL